MFKALKTTTRSSFVKKTSLPLSCGCRPADKPILALGPSVEKLGLQRPEAGWSESALKRLINMLQEEKRIKTLLDDSRRGKTPQTFAVTGNPQRKSISEVSAQRNEKISFKR